ALAVLIVLGLTVARNADVLAQNFEDLWDGIWATGQFRQVSAIVPAAGLAAAMTVAAAMVGSLFSAGAGNNGPFTAGETTDPRRNVPRSRALGTVIVIGLYVLANVAYLAALPIRGDSDDAMRLAAEALQAESTALTHEAAIKQLQSTIVQAQRLIARYENDLQ